MSPESAAKPTTNTYKLKTVTVVGVPVEPSEEEIDDKIETESNATKNTESKGVSNTSAPET